MDYFIGGLITGGLAFQPSGGLSDAVQFDAQIGRWMARFKKFGHASEDGVRTLFYDSQCCHVQGDCEWVACQDTVVSRLTGGTVGRQAAGLYIGGESGGKAVVVPPGWLGAGANTSSEFWRLESICVHPGFSVPAIYICACLFGLGC